jgi:DNA-binding transcriptional LysR family regulator
MKSLEQQLSRIDLNLLVALSVLIQERNVSRAAAKLYLSQPAMSRTLKRLRETFDDPLFYRESSGLQPTEKTLRLQEPLLAILGDIQKLLSQTQFSPELCDHTFKLSLPPLMSTFITVPIAKSLMKVAPNASLIETLASMDARTLLKNREVDYSIHISQPEEKEEFISQLIGHTHPVIYANPSHPLVQQSSPTLEQCLEYPYVDLNLDIRSAQEQINPIDKYLMSHGLERKIRFRSGQINNLLEVMTDSHTLLVATHLLQHVDNLNDKLVPVFSLDRAQDSAIPIYLIEHKRTADSAAHQWFKQLMLQELEQSALKG